MVNQTLYADNGLGISDAALKSAIEASLSDSKDQLKRVLLVVPDYTRYHSNGGKIANIYYHLLKDSSQVDILEALGTHVPMTAEEIKDMYGDIPVERFIPHDWRNDIVNLGEVPGEFVSAVSGGLIDTPIKVDVNKLLLESYDLVISIGQVVPHEVVGMANYNKNIFVGCGGSNMINSSHMLGAFYGMERIMGKDHSPVRKVLDYAESHFLQNVPLCYVLTVTTASEGNIQTHGLFIGRQRSCFEEAVALAQQKNLIFVDEPLKKVVVWLDVKEFKSTWLGNKSIYRTRMAIADGGELIVLAPGVEKFGEDPEIDFLIRKYGYRGRRTIIQLCEENEDLRNNLSAAAHLIHGSSDGRFNITYCTKYLSRDEVRDVCFDYMPYEEAVRKYDPNRLKDGYNVVDGEEIYYISNPALGLWADKAKF